MRVLDIASGWGDLRFLLSQRIAEVYPLEGIVERVDFQQIRHEQERADNITIFGVGTGLTSWLLTLMWRSEIPENFGGFPVALAESVIVQAVTWQSQ